MVLRFGQSWWDVAESQAFTNVRTPPYISGKLHTKPQFENNGRNGVGEEGIPKFDP